MKRISLLMIFASIFLLSANHQPPSQEIYYYGFDEKIYLTEVPNKFVLSFDEKYPSEIRQFLQKNAQIRLIDDTQIHNNVYILTIERSDVKLMEDLKNQVGVKSVNPMYAVEGGLEMGITDEIVVQFKDYVSQQEIDNNLILKYI